MKSQAAQGCEPLSFHMILTGGYINGKDATIHIYSTHLGAQRKNSKSVHHIMF